MSVAWRTRTPLFLGLAILLLLAHVAVFPYKPSVQMRPEELTVGENGSFPQSTAHSSAHAHLSHAHGSASAETSAAADQHGGPDSSVHGSAAPPPYAAPPAYTTEEEAEIWRAGVDFGMGGHEEEDLRDLEMEGMEMEDAPPAFETMRPADMLF